VVPSGVAAVLAYMYGGVLLEVLGGVRGAAAGLADAFGVEVQHILNVPQVRSMPELACSGRLRGV
jgi:hypothetical protein